MRQATIASSEPEPRSSFSQHASTLRHFLILNKSTCTINICYRRPPVYLIIYYSQKFYKHITDI